MSDFTLRTDSVDVEQIMSQIRARIREKRGVDYTEQQIQEMAAVKLERFLDPKAIRSDLVEQFKQRRQPPPPAVFEVPEVESFTFGEDTLYETHRSPLLWMRRLLQPILKLLFNPNPLIQVLYKQSLINQASFEREVKREKLSLERDKRSYDLETLYFEVMHNLVVEMTRLSIEVKNMKMRVESVSSRLDFAERRARALEGAVQYRPHPSPRTEPADPRPERPRDIPAMAAAPAGPPGPAGQASPQVGGATDGTRNRRRRRRRGRRGTGPGGAETAGGDMSEAGDAQQQHAGSAVTGNHASEPGPSGADSRADHDEPDASGRDPLEP